MSEMSDYYGLPEPPEMEVSTTEPKPQPEQMEILDLSLFHIVEGLGRLLVLWEEMEADQEDTTAIQEEIQAYFRAEVRKVDGIKGYYRLSETMAQAARAEAAIQAEHARMWEARCERIKHHVRMAMEYAGVKKLEGRTGSLHLRGNGGKFPVEIINESLVPDHLKLITVTMRLKAWKDLLPYYEYDVPPVVREIEVSKTLVGSELEKTCPVCNGAKSDDPCKTCGGSGKQGVPGARLEPRGKHVEIK